MTRHSQSKEGSPPPPHTHTPLYSAIPHPGPPRAAADYEYQTRAETLLAVDEMIAEIIQVGGGPCADGYSWMPGAILRMLPPQPGGLEGCGVIRGDPELHPFTSVPAPTGSGGGWRARQHLCVLCPRQRWVHLPLVHLPLLQLPAHRKLMACPDRHSCWRLGISVPLGTALTRPERPLVMQASSLATTVCTARFRPTVRKKRSCTLASPPCGLPPAICWQPLPYARPVPPRCRE